MQENINFIIIDDSNEDSFLIIKRLKSLKRTFNIKSFFSAQEAYKYISGIPVEDTSQNAKNIIILDIYMPLMTGFEFVEEFENLPEKIQNNYIICALTSSINKGYAEKISNYKSVKYFLEKPIKTQSLLDLIES